MIASVVFAVIGLLVLHASFQEYRSTQEADKYAKLHGCKEPVKEDPYDFLGIKKVYTSTRALLNKRALENAINAFEKHGETFGSRILAQRVFFTCSPRNIKHVLVSRFVDFEASSVRSHLFKPITEKGIFAVDGQEWKHARDLYRGLFTNTRSVTNIPKLESRFQTLLKYLPEGEAVDMQKLFLKLTLDMTSEFAIGESLDTLSPDTQSQEKKDLVKSLLYVDKILARDGFLGPAAAFLSKKEFHKCCGDVHRFVEKRIYAGLEKRRALKAKSEDLPEAFNILEGLMVNTEEMLELRDSATTILIAGVEGITSLIGTVFYLLSRNPRVQDKLRSIILETIGHEVPTFDQLQNLAYLRFVLNESKLSHNLTQHAYTNVSLQPCVFTPRCHSTPVLPTKTPPCHMVEEPTANPQS